MSNSAQCASAADRPESFQLKAGLFPMQLLDLKSADIESVQKELEHKISQAPALFSQSPIVFGFELLTDPEQDEVDMCALCDACRVLGLLPTATRGGNIGIQNASKALGLAVFPRGRTRAAEVEAEPPAPAEPASEAAPSPPTVGASPTKIISAPIRSGQQIYAPGGDLIILSSVSPGAEVLADGNIHIYGALRGRALAGVQGNEKARIFCSSQEAELVSVAGQFLVDENLRGARWKQPVQIYLTEGHLTIDPLP